ncbi:DUF4955 domain-containing protein [Flavivirga eckloniae]|uniref:Pectate lyase superfamily protein domain-containing protein n=1 Tax=Flavivirga eckloniae TaxID=1803846 RepID=A0A2K9PNY1_9FLAO|nr:DUF4955 domain-containing protein [Flavivirga eckloniae]AUP78518.1 hypothetical protein C1H87_07260 [Flavivirga eckloniae]
MLNKKLLFKYIIFPTLSLLCLPLIAQQPESDLYKQFVASKTTGDQSILPDFSYAGYKNGEEPIPYITGPVFNVNVYGALPDDDLEDYDGIQAAINAAQDAGGGVVFFPKGRFLINERKPVVGDAPRAPITITGDNIVLRGSGSGEDGTVLYCRYNRTKWLVANIQADGGGFSRTELADVTGGNERGKFELTVSTTAGMNVGDLVMLELTDPTAFNAEFLAPYQADFDTYKDTATLLKGGNFVQEAHEITAINGNIITFKDPLRYNVDITYKWVIKSITRKTGFGIEFLRMVGNATPDFEHHKNADQRDVINPDTALSDYEFHDGGFKAISINRYQNSWVRNVVLESWSNAIGFGYSTTSTVTDVLITGNTGHNSVQSFKSNNLLFSRVTDEASTWHGIEVSHLSSGAVVRDCKWRSWTPVDVHSGHPYCNLVDNSEGGMAGTPGGDITGFLPHHGRELVFWNYNEIDTEARVHDFWNEKKKILTPIVVGYEGNSSFVEATLAHHESHGTHVKTPFLYDAQLELRLGVDPVWIKEIATQTVADADEDGVSDADDTCPGTPSGVTVDVNGCEVFSLPKDNFKILHTSESCRTSNNGTISIEAVQNLNYTATLSGGSTDSKNFTNTISFENLEANAYTVCITVEGESDYETCFNITITEPEDLGVTTKVDQGKKQIDLTLSGSTDYVITVNDIVYQTSKNKISIPLSNGVNNIVVKTGKDCQGIHNQKVLITNQMVSGIHPNPITSGDLTIALNDKSTKDPQNVEVVVNSISGKQLLNLKATNKKDIKINIDDLTKGLYFISIKTKSEVQTYKIIKK